MVIRAMDPSPLLTLTMTGAADRCSSGRNACVTRTTPNTFVSNTSRIISPVTSAAPDTPPSGLRASIPGVVDQHVKPAVGLDGLRGGRRRSRRR